MERFVIVMPVDTSAYLLPCDDGDTCKLETLQKLVGGPIEMADTCLAASWAREDVDSIQMAVNEEGLLQELPYNEHATDLYAFNYMSSIVGPAVLMAARGRRADRLCKVGGREHLRRVGDSAGSDRYGRVLPDL